MCSVQQRNFFYASVIKCILKLFKCLQLYFNTNYRVLLCIYQCKPVRGDPGHTLYIYMYVGHLTSVAFPTLENLTKNLGPKVGTFAFFARRNRTKSYHSMCLSVFRAAIKALKDSCFQWR